MKLIAGAGVIPATEPADKTAFFMNNEEKVIDPVEEETATAVESEIPATNAGDEVSGEETAD